MREFKLSFAAIGLGLSWMGTAVSADYSRGNFGMMPDGTPCEGITLRNSRGVTARIIAYGATLQSLVVPDRQGAGADVVLGYSDLDSYLSKPEYFGATVGRVANRIAHGRFALDGKTYELDRNDAANTLHGGRRGFDKVLWRVAAVKRGQIASVELQFVSPDGEEGFPGTLTTTATYALSDQNELSVEYRATTDRPTVVNLSNHTYWNLAGEGTAAGAMGLRLMIAADRYLPVDATLIPTGELRAVQGTVFDFRKSKVIGRDVRDASDPQIIFGKGFDHNWVVGDAPADAPRLQARVEDPASGRALEVWSKEPGLQFYSGNFLAGTRVGKSGHLYRQGDGIALEPQRFPDIVNQPAFGSARLDPGQVYRHQIIFKLLVVTP